MNDENHITDDYIDYDNPHHNAYDYPVDDPTEARRKARLIELNQGLTPDEKTRLEALQAQYGQVWNKAQLGEDFEVLGFMAPYVVVRERATGKKGSLEFTHMPRLYFNWVED